MTETQPFLADGSSPPRSPTAATQREARGWLRPLLAGTVSLMLLGSFAAYTWAGDVGRWKAQRYARALQDAEALREECDDGLRQSYLGRHPAAVRALCVDDPAKPALPAHSSALRFLLIGDWGRDGMCCQHDVAARMNEVAESWQPEFVMNVGDNFYPAGLRHEHDDQVATSWDGVYRLPHMRHLEWSTIAGNHEHYGNVTAELQLPKYYPHWKMPALQYSELRHGGQVHISYFDSTPMYYGRQELLTDFQTNFSNAEADVRRQLKQLDEELTASKAPWKLVVGHHPLFSTGSHFEGEPECLERMRKLIQPLLHKHNAPAYFCGHEHSLEHAEVDGVHYFVSGAGSKVRAITNHERNNLFAIGRQGFMAVAVEENMLFVYVIDLAGVVLHTAEVPRKV